MTDKTSVADWSTTASDNDNVGGVELAENKMRPKDVNNSIRTLMAQVKAAADDASLVPDGGIDAGKISDTASDQQDIAYKIGAVSTNTQDIYVDATLGDDTTGDGTEAAPYATPQKAWDSLPFNVLNQVTIHIADGTYSTSCRASTDMQRPALLHLDMKKMGKRTDRPGGVMVGSVVFKGESKAGVIFQPGSADGYIRGIYATGHVGSVAIQNLTIDAQTGTESGIVAHRGAYVHLSDIDIDGNGLMTYGIVGEAAGFLEGLNVEIHHCTYGVQCYQASTVQLSLSSNIHDCSTRGINVPNGGYVGLTTGSVCSSGVLVQAGGKLDLTGISGSRITVSGALEVRGGDVTMAFADLTGAITTYPGSRINAGAMGWSKQWTDYGAELYLPGCKSYVAPATQSDVATPLYMPGEERRLYVDSTFQLINNAGTEVAENIGFGAVAIASDAVAITDALVRRSVNVANLTTTAARNNITLPSGMSGRSAGAPIPAGYILDVINNSASGITLVPGSIADFVGASSFTIGTSTGQYAGVHAIMGSAGKWIVTPLGGVRS